MQLALWVLVSGLLQLGAFEYGPPGDPSCWLENMNFETCCLPPPRGNAFCWEGGFTYERCCRRDPNQPVDINKVAEISELGGCELNIFQEFKERAGRSTVTSWLCSPHIFLQIKAVFEFTA